MRFFSSVVLCLCPLVGFCQRVRRFSIRSSVEHNWFCLNRLSVVRVVVCLHGCVVRPLLVYISNMASSQYRSFSRCCLNPLSKVSWSGLIQFWGRSLVTPVETLQHTAATVSMRVSLSPKLLEHQSCLHGRHRFFWSFRDEHPSVTIGVTTLRGYKTIQYG